MLEEHLENKMFPTTYNQQLEGEKHFQWTVELNFFSMAFLTNP